MSSLYTKEQAQIRLQVRVKRMRENLAFTAPELEEMRWEHFVEEMKELIAEVWDAAQEAK